MPLRRSSCIGRVSDSPGSCYVRVSPLVGLSFSNSASSWAIISRVAQTLGLMSASQASRCDLWRSSVHGKRWVSGIRCQVSERSGQGIRDSGIAGGPDIGFGVCVPSLALRPLALMCSRQAMWKKGVRCQVSGARKTGLRDKGYGIRDSKNKVSGEGFRVSGGTRLISATKKYRCLYLTSGGEPNRRR
jgi:hypothetical protein